MEGMKARIPPDAGQGDEPSGGMVLVVDDHPLVLGLVARVLRLNGFKVETAGNGGEALERLANDGDGIDLLLTDIDMPGLDGPSLAERVNRDLPDLPIVYMTGRPSRGMGRFPVLSKPFENGHLIEMVGESIDGG